MAQDARAIVPSAEVRSRALTADRVWARVVQASALAAILIVALVVLFLLLPALPAVRDVGLVTFFTSTQWDPDSCTGFGGHACSFGALMPIFGSLIAVGIALLISVPISFALATVIAEVHPRIGDRYFRPAIEVFVGIPSVVYGWIGLTTLVPLLGHWAPSGFVGSSYLAASIVLAVMVMPTITTLAADALQVLPGSLREASAALGATQWQTIWRVLLPAARAGLTTAVVLGFARAMGEALAVALVIGDTNNLPDFAHHGIAGLLTPGTTITVSITDGIQHVADNPQGTAARYLLALVLLLLVFVVISVVRALQKRTALRA